MINVTWEDARAFCDYYGYRLPTEAQWEKAARGSEPRRYPWGDSWDAQRCNNWEFPENSVMLNLHEGGGTLPAGWFDGSRSPAKNGASPYGAMDMAGNVWEWCEDWYNFDYYAQSPGRNPEPKFGKPRGSPNGKILLGGSWRNLAYKCRVTHRGNYDPVTCRSECFGFRCVRKIPGGR